MSKTTHEMILEGVRMRRMRVTMKMKVKEAADLIGVKSPNYSHMERGRQNITEKRMRIMERKCKTFIDRRIRELEKEIDMLKHIMD